MIMKLKSLPRCVLMASLVLLVLCPSPANAKTEPAFDTDASIHSSCTAVQECEMCTFRDQQSDNSCKETGRRQKFKCREEESSDAGALEFRSCKYTKSDEEFSMIRMQMFCLLLGSMAAMRIRKEKSVSASLFDQRRQGGAADKPDQRKRRNSDGLRPLQTNMKEQEMTPLVATSNNPLEVV